MIVDPDFLTHWKTRGLISAVGETGVALTALISLWGHCQTRKAWQFPLTALRLAGICGYEGKAEKLFDAMMELNIIERVDGELGWYEVHGWAERNERLIHNWGSRCGGWDPKGAPPSKDKPKDPSKDKPKDPSKGVSIGLDRIGEDRNREPLAATSSWRECFEFLVRMENATVEGLTDPHRKAIEVALATIWKVAPDVTPAQLQDRANVFASKWPQATLTAPALAKHWAALENKKKEGAPTAPSKPPSVEPEWDWRAVAARLFDQPVTLPWVELPASARYEIRQAHAAEAAQGTVRTTKKKRAVRPATGGAAADA